MQLHHTPTPSLSSSSSICPFPLSLSLPFPSPSLPPRRPTFLIRMGGGPRTYPGGVSKWQWKRMQLYKAKHLLKARLARERQLYEMRKRAELKAAIADLERPWEVVQRAAPSSSALFSVAADEQLKVLADRFQKPGGFDLWGEEDGPQLFETPDGVPTARFFPKGVVHSIKPYGPIVEENEGDSGAGGADYEDEDRVAVGNSGGRRNSSRGSGELNSQNPFDSGGKLNSPRKDRGGFRNSSDNGGLHTGVGPRRSRGGGNGMNSRSESRGGKSENGSFAREAEGDERSSVNYRSRVRGGKLRNGSFAREAQDSGEESSRFAGSRSSYGGNNGHDRRRLDNNGRVGGSRSGTRDGKLGNGSFVREGKDLGDERSRFAGSRSAYGGKNERDGRRWDSDGRVGGYRVGGNGVKLKDLGGRRAVSSSPNMRSNGRNGSFAGETEDLGDGRSRFSGSRASYGGKNEHDRKGRDNDDRGGGYGVHGRRSVSSSGSVRNNGGRKQSSRGNVGRFGRSKSEDVYDMSLQRNGSYGFSDRGEDGMN